MTNIKRANQAHAYRMLQCLTVAIRPLTVAELAELLAFDFDVAEGEMPKLKPNWRWEDHEQAILSTCSSLVTVVPQRYGSLVVQFSHFSVKEFLMSDRLATSRRDISQYHISLEDAHLLLTRASLAILLSDPDANTHSDNAPLAKYAAEHWVTHSQVKSVALQVRDGMQCLFDPDKPYFEAWIKLHDIDSFEYSSVPPDPEPGARPLYYAALGGFHALVERFILKYPQCASARGGLCGTALHSASFSGHLQVVRYLLRQGVDVNVRNTEGDTPLLLASLEGHLDVVQCLVDHGANLDLCDKGHSSPLMLAVCYGHVDIVRLLLEHNADVNSQDCRDQTALHDAIGRCTIKANRSQIVRLLLKHGANANARDLGHQTPLHLVSKLSYSPDLLDVLGMLLEHGADLDVEDKDGKTPLQLSLDGEVTRLLTEYSTTKSMSR